MKILQLIIIAFLVYGCESKIQQDAHPIDSAKQENLSRSEDNQSLHQLTSHLGKYPMKEKLFSKEPLESRLKQLLGKEWEDLNKYWNTETPIKKEDNVLHTSGCKAHDCALNAYDLYIDVENDVINVYHIKNGKQKIYKEKDEEISLPSGFAKEIEVKRQNAGLEVLPPRL